MKRNVFDETKHNVCVSVFVKYQNISHSLHRWKTVPLQFNWIEQKRKNNFIHINWLKNDSNHNCDMCEWTCVRFYFFELRNYREWMVVLIVPLQSFQTKIVKKGTTTSFCLNRLGLPFLPLQFHVNYDMNGHTMTIPSIPLSFSVGLLLSQHYIKMPFSHVLCYWLSKK